MVKLLSGIIPLLIFAYSYAQEAKDAPPPETTNMIGIIIFAVIFFGLIIGYFVYMWWGHRKDKKD